MPNVLRFPDRVKRPRACRGCGVALAKDAPPRHYACRRCFSYAQFRKAVESFRKVKP
jgi:hypothetical protein